MKKILKKKCEKNTEKLISLKFLSWTVIDAQAANALIGAGDERIKTSSEQLMNVTEELLKIQNKRKNTCSHGQSLEKKKEKTIATSSDRL